MPPCRILILAPLAIEARAIAHAFSLPTPTPSNPLASNGTITLAIIGPRAAQWHRLSPAIHAQGIIMAGLAGALAPHLNVGDLVADPPPPPTFTLPPHITCHTGPLHTSPAIIATPAQKAALFQQTHALAVDMETDLIRDYARHRGIPFLALRAISDSASHTLNPALLKFVDPHGHSRPTRAALYALIHPWRIPELLRIARASTRALSSLSASLVVLAASGWPETSPRHEQQNPPV